ncbi:MAG: hypothetical protein AAGB48_11670 [Planctomycetota bacterium]
MALIRCAHNRTAKALLAGAGFSLAPWLLTGCATQHTPDAETVSEAPGNDWLWTDDAEDAPDTSLSALIAQQAQDLESMTSAGPVASGAEALLDRPPPISLDRPTRSTRRGPAPGRSDEPHTPGANDALLRALSLAGGGSGQLAGQTGAPPEPEDDTKAEPAEPIERGARIAALVGELAALLKEDALDADDPTRPLVPAALLGAIAEGVIDEADLPGGGPLMLSDDERAALRTIRELAVRLVANDGSPAGDPARIREVLLSAAEGLRDRARVRIAAAELATRAPAFGSYVPVERRTFLAGRRHRLVVYAEVEHFGLRPATSAEAATQGDTVAADVTQELELYLREGDPKPTWSRTVEWLPRTSRRSFQDMFVATPIELPATLSVGMYDLKVRITDDVTGAQDEVVLPIRLVADASALSEPPSMLADRRQTPAGSYEPPNQVGFSPSFATGPLETQENPRMR